MTLYCTVYNTLPPWSRGQWTGEEIQFRFVWRLVPPPPPQARAHLSPSKRASGVADAATCGQRLLVAPVIRLRMLRFAAGGDEA
ncbi:predicted protein [Plenodomus lingam JN3]|uniref:Predicted protein n=1 Tax=Leptosphaeria maculans (strain JN3 / isolate v23.1.3 / race Av1-4-5-6-7-8) TaxID=985895 RepID=E4ZWD3_LEPMJ|nr:predicted protein [Plenodomus lingam JN3]CBX95909.1 predicted protein [Plenodomus lingam JN3]